MSRITYLLLVLFLFRTTLMAQSISGPYPIPGTGGGSATNLTPWTSDINGAGHALTNASTIVSGNFVSQNGGSGFIGNGVGLTNVSAASISGTAVTNGYTYQQGNWFTNTLTGVAGTNDVWVINAFEYPWLSLQELHFSGAFHGYTNYQGTNLAQLYNNGNLGLWEYSTNLADAVGTGPNSYYYNGSNPFPTNDIGNWLINDVVGISASTIDIVLNVTSSNNPTLLNNLGFQTQIAPNPFFYSYLQNGVFSLLNVPVTNGLRSMISVGVDPTTTKPGQLNNSLMAARTTWYTYPSTNLANQTAEVEVMRLAGQVVGKNERQVLLFGAGVSNNNAGELLFAVQAPNAPGGHVGIFNFSEKITTNGTVALGNLQGADLNAGPVVPKPFAWVSIYGDGSAFANGVGTGGSQSGGTTSVFPAFGIASQSLVGTPVAGSIENDGSSPYYTSDAGTRTNILLSGQSGNAIGLTNVNAFYISNNLSKLYVTSVVGPLVPSYTFVQTNIITANTNTLGPGGVNGAGIAGHWVSSSASASDASLVISPDYDLSGKVSLPPSMETNYDQLDIVNIGTLPGFLKYKTVTFPIWVQDGSVVGMYNGANSITNFDFQAFGWGNMQTASNIISSIGFGPFAFPNATRSMFDIGIGDSTGAGIKGRSFNNIFVGHYTAQATTGTNNVLIGNGLEAPVLNGTNQLNIVNSIWATNIFDDASNGNNQGNNTPANATVTINSNLVVSSTLTTYGTSASSGEATSGTNRTIFSSVSSLTNTTGRDVIAAVTAGTSVILQDTNGNNIVTIGTIATLDVMVPLRVNMRLSGTGVSATLY